jgi:signal transduction histidine kinase
MTVPVFVAALIALVALAIGWMAGRGRTPELPPDPYPPALARLSAALRGGEAGSREPDEPTAISDVRDAVSASWVPVDASREEALKQALGRIAAFLGEAVEGPLKAVRGGDADLLNEGVERALGGLQDLEFFLREPLTPDETHNLVSLLQQVTREFIVDWETAVRFSAPAFPVRAHIHRASFLDAVYLLLHNAGHFGGRETVDVMVESVGDEARVTIRDRGPGFTDEALERARDLFYTTRPGALGLGLPFARRVIEGFGGHLEVGNHPDGGAVVTMVLPGA